MKKAMQAALALCLWGGVVAAQAATEAIVIGVYGFVKVQVPALGGVNLVGLNFTSAETMYLSTVLGNSTLIKNDDPAQADSVYLWDDTQQEYVRYFQKSDDLFYLYNAPNGEAVEVEVATGDALFLRSPDATPDTHNIYLHGSVSLEDSLPVSYQNQTVFANPYPVEMNLNSNQFDWSDAVAGSLPTQADQLHIWDPNKAGGAGYQNYFLKESSGSRQWCECESPFTPADPILPVGGGAYYTAKGTFSNTIIRPFDI